MFSSDCVLCVLLIETYNRTIIFAGRMDGRKNTTLKNLLPQTFLYRK